MGRPGDVLKALAPRLEPAQVQRASDDLIANVENGTHADTLGASSEGLDGTGAASGTVAGACAPSMPS